MSGAPASRIAPRFVLLALLAAAAVVVGTTGSHYLTVTSKDSSKHVAKKAPHAAVTAGPVISSPVSSETDTAFATDPPPPLLESKQLTAVNALITAQRTAAHAAIKTYWAGHGTRTDDAGFVTWAVAHLPSAPGTLQRRQEGSTLATLKDGRSATGLAAARWLNRHGNTDVWQVLRSSQTEFRAGSEDKSSASELRAATDLAAKITRQASERTALSAPYVVDASIRDDQKSTATRPCPCSYPSSPSARSAAASAYLGALSPERRGEYQFMQAQVDAAELYRADAFPSDVSAGTFIGDLVSAYVLVTRGHANP